MQIFDNFSSIYLLMLNNFFVFFIVALVLTLLISYLISKFNGWYLTYCFLMSHHYCS